LLVIRHFIFFSLKPNELALSRVEIDDLKQVMPRTHLLTSQFQSFQPFNRHAPFKTFSRSRSKIEGSVQHLFNVCAQPPPLPALGF
jgi:hypothetical protein